MSLWNWISDSRIPKVQILIQHNPGYPCFVHPRFCELLGLRGHRASVLVAKLASVFLWKLVRDTCCHHVAPFSPCQSKSIRFAKYSQQTLLINRRLTVLYLICVVYSSTCSRLWWWMSATTGSQLLGAYYHQTAHKHKLCGWKEW